MDGNIAFSCDTKEFKRLAEALTGKEMKKVTRKALQKGSSVLVRKTRAEMKRAGFKFRPGMDKAVQYRIKRGGQQSAVHLFGEHSLSGKNRGIVRFLEMGTRERYRGVKHYYSKGRRITKTISGRKPGYSGKIKGYHFFRNARNSSENLILRTIESTIEKEIVKFNKQK